MSAPTHFYRYQTCERIDRLEPILLHHELYFPTAAELNDPLDCQPRIAKASLRHLARFLVRMFSQANPRASIDERAEVLRVATEGINALGIEAQHAEISKYFHASSSGTRILSLSTRWNNMSLWAKYAADHTGYCLEFANLGMFSRARPVVYGDPVDLDVTSPSALADSLENLYRKTRDWANEDEYRIVGPTVAPSRLEMDSKWLTRIILGKDMKKANRDVIRKWSRLRVPPLVVVEAQFNQLERQLELV